MLFLLPLMVLCSADPIVSTRTVTIRDMSFQPAEIEVRVGDSVTWTNRDDRDHTVVADGLFNSNNLSSGATFTFRFNKPGSFAYACSYHPRMRGRVNVVE